MMFDDLGYLGISEAARLIGDGEVSPLELTEALLARIERLDGHVRAYLHVASESALAQARQAEQARKGGVELGPLHGVPVAIKDIVDVAGMPTTAGSRALAGNVAAADAALVAALRGAGAIVLGKTNTHEFAYGVLTPPTRNPWDLTRIPGGSSGGSAAALAAGLALGAVGTDTAGSIRLPSALCGVVGLKPSYDRVSRHGVIPLSWSLDHAGPMTRGVADAALLFDVMADGDTATHTALTADVRGLRVGVPRAYFYDDLAPAVTGAVEAALGTLAELGMELQEMALPGVETTFAVGRAVQRPEASAYHHTRLRAAPELYGPELRADLEVGALFLATDYIHAQRVRATLREQWLEVMRGFDVLVTPTVPVAAISVDAAMSSGGVKGTLLRNTYPFNLAGLPALSLPCGFTPEGLPIGMQIVGRPFDEATVLRASHAYEAATPWHTMHPTLQA